MSHCFQRSRADSEQYVYPDNAKGAVGNLYASLNPQ